MAKLLSILVALALSLAPAAARAGTIWEGSVGSGLRWQPSPVERIPTNVMVAVGYSTKVLKLELGAMGNLADVKHSKFDLELRPMLVVKPPLLPIYARAITGVSGLLEKPVGFVYGAAVGVRMGALGVGAFLEAGAVAKRLRIEDKDKDVWYAEGRLGVYWD
jgi:hypothetical protein